MPVEGCRALPTFELQGVGFEGLKGPAVFQSSTVFMRAHKYCEANGTWFRHPVSDQVWSNYTTCVNLKDLNWQQGISGIYEAGYAISLVALLLSLGILTYFRSLRCARITLHMNLFASFAVNNALWLVWYRCIVANTDLLLNNGITCRLLHIILHYFLLTNYAWMLCEGFYLHTLLVSAFTSEHKLVKWLMGLGWPVPAVIVTIYASLRATSDDPADTEQCWINEGNYINVLVYPVCVSTLLNVLFLFNIVRVLLMKLRAGPTIGTQPSRSMRQAFSNATSRTSFGPTLPRHPLQTAEEPPLGAVLRSSFCHYSLFPAHTISTHQIEPSPSVHQSMFITGVPSGVTVARQRASLSARPQVRCREKRRCDYQSSAPDVLDEKRILDDRQQTVQLIAANPVPNSHTNHARVLVKSNDASNCEQTQC
ncbi:Calcitonin receptor [Eufriesea mexicana]|nr:Calcitonin receptor [Eufriesea mexicana]